MELSSEGVERMRRLLRHRLLNIISGVKSANSLLASDLDDRLTPREREYFSLIQKESDQVCVIVDRIDALFGPLPNPELGPLEAVLPSLIADFRELHPLAEVDLDVNVQDLSRMVCRPALRSALFEMAENAYTITRKPVLLSVTDVEAGYSFRVIDQGEPLSDECLEMAFEPFYSTRTRHLGVGLSIAKRGVEQLGGVVSVGTGPDGNFVEFVLPCE